MSGAHPFRMLARVPDDVRRDMPHMMKTFPGKRAFIPSNSGRGGRCSQVRRKRTLARHSPGWAAHTHTERASMPSDTPQGPHAPRETRPAQPE